MSRQTAVLGRLVGATILATGLVLCTTNALHAQEPASSVVTVDLVAEDLYSHPQPKALVHVDRPGYVALFEVEPGVGATMLYPDDPDDPRRYGAGIHELRLNGLPTAVRRQLMAWHLGWAFAHRQVVVPQNHLLVVVSEKRLDLSDLRSQRIFRHTKGDARVEEVSDALLSSVTDGLAPGSWTFARTSYDKQRDPWLLARAGVWLDAPFLPHGRELAFTGYPPPGTHTFTFSCGPGFTITNEFFYGRTAHDLNVCRHVQPDARTLADLNWQDPWTWAEKVAKADERPAGEPDGEASSPVQEREALPEEVRETLQRIADAAKVRSSERNLESLRRLEATGAAMRARGIDVDATRLRALRVRAQVRARVRRMARNAGIDVKIVDGFGDRPIDVSERGQPGGVGGSRGPGARRGSSSIYGSGSGGAVGRSNPRAGVPSASDVRRRARSNGGRDGPRRDRSGSSDG